MDTESGESRTIRVFADPVSIAKMLRDAQRDEDENYSFVLVSKQ